MSFDSFFKELVTTNNEDEQKPVCFCRHPRKGQLGEQPDGSHKFEGECSPDKACFKIQFDCARSVSKNMHVLTRTSNISSKKRREWESIPRACALAGGSLCCYARAFQSYKNE